ncbi:CENPK protein, partial [Fregata magnificens]|nr:CENPK protein [Fregata magnificens]
LPEITHDSVCPVGGKEQLLDECEHIWKQMEECHSKLMLLGMETVESDDKLTFLMMRAKALTAEYNQWQKISPEAISANPDVLLALGKEELQEVKKDLAMLLSTVQSKNKKLEEDLKRDFSLLKKNLLIILLNFTFYCCVFTISPNTRAFHELQSKMLKLKIYKEEILNALGEFLEENFPLPEKNSSEEPPVELLTLHEVLEILINKLMNSPHEPYVTINDSFWPPYIELLLRYGIALRHPEDPKRIRLEAF